MTAILSYSAQHYNSLPSIVDAGANFTSIDASRVSTIIGQVFIKHKVEKFFGTVLLQNHFSIDTEEKLVNFGSVAVPCKSVCLGYQASRVGGSAWRFMEQGVAAYEFAYNTSPQPDLSNYQPFLSELKSVIEEMNLLEKLGICALDSEDADSDMQIEFTQGRANITLPLDVTPDHHGVNRSIETVWQFESGLELGNGPTPLVVKKCKVACKYGPNTGHCGDHKTTKF